LKNSGKATVKFRVVGDRLPGLKWGRSRGALVDREPVYVGVQRKHQVVGLTPGDAKRAVFRFPIEVRSTSDGEFDYSGPFVHGKKGGRFIYLSWGGLGGDGAFTMFRRAKLKLAEIDKREMERILSSKSPVVIQGRLKMTDEEGGPVCGSSVSEKVKWRVIA
jgi:hypothetical protein